MARAVRDLDQHSVLRVVSGAKGTEEGGEQEGRILWCLDQSGVVGGDRMERGRGTGWTRTGDRLKLSESAL